MGKYFADIHASAASQLGDALCTLEDTPEVTALRGTEDYDNLVSLGNALCYQMRFCEAIEVYTKAVKQNPDRMDAYRRRAARYLTTLQPDLAIQDFLRCRELGGDEGDLSYRLGICRYLTGEYGQAMEELERCYPLHGDEMGIAVIYWHTLSAWRAGEAPALLERSYHPGMEVGHHTAYELCMALASGNTALPAVMERLEHEESDLEYSMLSYGSAVYLAQQGEKAAADRLIRSIVERDGFWVSYAYLAAWNDTQSLPAPLPVEKSTPHFKYTVTDGAVTITKYIGTERRVSIPYEIEDKPVKIIGGSAFAWTDITSLSGGEQVTDIGPRAFYNCQSLAFVRLGGRVAAIGDDAFGFCRSLRAIILPDSVTAIGNESFARCDALSNVEIGDGLRIIGRGAFYDSGVVWFRVSEGNAAFTSADGALFRRDMTELVQYPGGHLGESYHVPAGVTVIGPFAFAWSKVKEVICPDSIKEIHDFAFSYSQVEHIVLGKNLHTIGRAAMEYCHVLQDVVFPENLIEIGEAAFFDCCGLTTVTLPDSVRTVGRYAFQYCTSIETVEIGRGLRSIGDGAFYGGNFSPTEGRSHFMQIKSFTLRSREAEIDTYQLGYVHGLTLCGWRGGSLERYAKRVGDAVFLALDAPDKRGGYKENHACQ